MTPNSEKSRNRLVRIFRGKEGLRALEADWHTLERDMPNARFIHFFGWFKSHLENTEPNPESVIFLLVSEGEKPIAIFPLHQVATRRFGVPLRSWEIFWQNDMGISDFVFAATQENKDLLELVAESLKANTDTAWDCLRLEDILVDSAAHYSLKESGLRLTLSIKRHKSKYISCDTDHETVMSRLSGHFRRNVRRQAKKINELGGIEYRFVSDPEDLNEAFDYFLQAEASSWKGGMGTGSAILLHPERVGMYRTLMNEFARYGACSINLILQNGNCIASQFCLTVGDTLYLLKIGYSDEFRAIGPGNVLLNQLIQRCCSDGTTKKISFVTGASWNDSWSPEWLDVYEGYIFNHTMAGISVYLLETIKNYGRRLKLLMQEIRQKQQKENTP